MPDFPIPLPPLEFNYTSARPVVEEASATTCLARAKFKPKNISYETVVKLAANKWTVTTLEDGKAIVGGGVEDYPLARGLQIGMRVINWWTTEFAGEPIVAVHDDLIEPRAMWISRAAHKLLTELEGRSDRSVALSILASAFGVALSSSGNMPSIKAVEWVAEAKRTLERAVPEAARPRAIALLADVITGSPPGRSAAAT